MVLFPLQVHLQNDVAEAVKGPEISNQWQRRTGERLVENLHAHREVDTRRKRMKKSSRMSCRIVKGATPSSNVVFCSYQDASLFESIEYLSRVSLSGPPSLLRIVFPRFSQIILLQPWQKKHQIFENLVFFLLSSKAAALLPDLQQKIKF